MYRKLMDDGWDLESIDSMDIHWFFACMEIDPKKSSKKKHGYIDDIVW